MFLFVLFPFFSLPLSFSVSVSFSPERSTDSSLVSSAPTPPSLSTIFLNCVTSVFLAHRCLAPYVCASLCVPFERMYRRDARLLYVPLWPMPAVLSNFPTKIRTTVRATLSTTNADPSSSSWSRFVFFFFIYNFFLCPALADRSRRDDWFSVLGHSKRKSQKLSCRFWFSIDLAQKIMSCQVSKKTKYKVIGSIFFSQFSIPSVS